MSTEKRKSILEIMKQVRGNWTINPRTRVQDNKLKDKKKRRQTEKKILKDEE